MIHYPGTRRASALLFTLLLVLGFGCSKADESARQRSDLSDDSYLMDKTADEEAKSERMAQPSAPASGMLANKKEADDGLEAAFAVNAALNRTDRLLEYEVNLNYLSDDLHKSRLLLLTLPGKDCFMLNAASDLESDPGSMTMTMRVRTENLYEFMLKLDTIGKLQSERISANDHTENMALQNIIARREDLRARRRQQLLATADQRNRTDAERLLSQGEDRQDQTEHERWKINDRINWATVHITVQNPEQPAQLSVPVYRNALVYAANVFMYLLYALLFILPFALVLALLIFAIIRISRRFCCKKPKQ